MKSLGLFLAGFALLLDIGCTVHVADPMDTRPLAAYQNLQPGTPVAVVLRVGLTVNGVERDAPDLRIEQEGTLAWITKDSVGFNIQQDGGSATTIYAGRMIREIRVKKAPNKAPEPTAWAVTICADAQLAPAHAVAHL